MAFLPLDKRTIMDYNLIELSAQLDYLIILTLEYHGAWDYKINANAPLRTRDSLDNIVKTSVT